MVGELEALDADFADGLRRLAQHAEPLHQRVVLLVDGAVLVRAEAPVEEEVVDMAVHQLGLARRRLLQRAEELLAVFGQALLDGLAEGGAGGAGRRVDERADARGPIKHLALVRGGPVRLAAACSGDAGPDSILHRAVGGRKVRRRLVARAGDVGDG